ncbi:hypothetical protein NA57DRAFT_53128 [Rhizodiscina lignyota]|uniref:Uncharacterized protein n=1 Tax=Rhizodiscina lignyota TaxID=1504668 RepID=A0A9P4IQQ1_9PEZI|nr:hypothetical protein NA57DRAFT_53128 [Rhizodiscina lignyota]
MLPPPMIHSNNAAVAGHFPPEPSRWAATPAASREACYPLGLERLEFNDETSYIHFEGDHYTFRLARFYYVPLYAGDVTELDLNSTLYLCRRDCLMYLDHDLCKSEKQLFKAIWINWFPFRGTDIHGRGASFFCHFIPTYPPPTTFQLCQFHETLRSAMESHILDPANERQFARFRDDGESPMLSLKDIFIKVDKEWQDKGVSLVCRTNNSDDVLKFLEATEHGKHDHTTTLDRTDCYCILRVELPLAMMAIMFRDPRRMDAHGLDSSAYRLVCSYYERLFGVDDPYGPLKVFGKSPLDEDIDDLTREFVGRAMTKRSSRWNWLNT